MATLEELIRIKKHPNPFDHVTYGNFWLEKPQYKTVHIHQEQITKIKQEINYLINDPLHKTRTLLLTGEQGCGKSHFLGRLKQKFNSQAFFVYIQPIPDKDYLWRHTLRYTLDSLMQTPLGETDSQIRLWLKGLPILQNEGLLKKLLGEKKYFIRELRSVYPTGIYEPKKFFGVLYELAREENYLTACDWLKGEQLDEEDLDDLKINKSIDTEIEAQGILNNFGMIANATKPIVLCFDQIERARDNIFELNTSFHNECLRNFLIIISVIKQQWEGIKKEMIQSDLSRITDIISLEKISFEKVEELWQSRLEPLHNLCNPKPESSIAPLNKNKLEQKAPAGKINLRESLNLGGILYKEYAESKPTIPEPITPEPTIPEVFITLWDHEFKKTKDKVKNPKQFSEPELLDMLTLVLELYKVRNINRKLVSGKNSNYCFSYTCPKTEIKQVLVLQENPNGTSFNALMNACQKIIEGNKCDSLFLLRNENVGNPKTKGNQLYNTLFKPLSKEYIHLKYSLEDIHYLNTYYKLAKDAYSHELVMEFKELSLKELQNLAIKHRVLANCQLLQKLEIVKPINNRNSEEKKGKEIKEFPSNDDIFLIVKNNLIIGLNALVEKIKENPKFSHIKPEDIKKIVDDIREQDKSVTLLGKGEDLIINYVPSQFKK